MKTGNKIIDVAGHRTFFHLGWMVVVFIFCACEEIVEFDSHPSPKISLNCVLNPDSLVQLSLLHSHALSDTTAFVPVVNALVVFYEDGQQWGIADYKSNGIYQLDKHPVIGKTYRVEASVEGHASLTAETTVPDRPEIDMTILSEKPYEYSSSSEIYYLTVNYKIKDHPGKDYYWNYCLRWFSKKQIFVGGLDMYTLSPYADSFNREVDAEKRLGFFYHCYVRQTDDGIDGQVMEFNNYIKALDIDCFFNADEHYDRYMKTSMQAWLLDWNAFVLFKEPVQIYSNIENGTGIFGAASFTCFNYYEKYKDR